MADRPALTPLQELSDAESPQGLRQPEARAAVLRVTQQLRKLPIGDMWPKAFQIPALAFCDLAGDRAIVADDMGFGKTGIGLCRIMLGNHFPAIVVCTSSTFLNWQMERAKWFPSMPIHLLDKASTFVPAPGWRGMILTTWDMLRHHHLGLVALKPRILISDEAHAITYNPESQRSRAHALIAAAAPHVLLMTGTPIKNTAAELWRLLCIIDPRWEGREESFKNISKDDLLKRDASPLALAVRNYMVRRLKSATIIKDLPTKQYRTLDVTVSPRAMKRYRYIEGRFRLWLEQEMERRLREELVGVEDAELREQVAERVARTMEAQSLAKMGYLRRAVGLMKAPAALAWILNMIEMGEPVVVFAEHEPVLAYLQRGLARHRAPFVLIAGKVSKAKRQRAIEKFTEGEVDVFLASQAAKEGINLVRARHLLFVERWWTPAGEDQAADRIYRIGQTSAVCIWLLRIKGTVDERMASINDRKRVIFRRVVNREVVKK